MHQNVAIISFFKRRKFIACIYDIPEIKFAGKFDRILIKRAWKKLIQAKLVWCSDIYKAALTQEFGRLKNPPLVCHNAPPLDYLKEVQQKEYLKDYLIRNGFEISAETVILLRAGALGKYGGIEETIKAISSLPENLILVLMGRPTCNYKQDIGSLVTELGLTNRVHIIDKPDNLTWKMVLSGSDIGHLIQINPEKNEHARLLYKLNNSLSNNRLFQYMGAGLPILISDDPRLDMIYQIQGSKSVSLNNLVESLKSKLTELLNDREEKKEMGRKNQFAFSKTYNWEYQFKPVLNCINELMYN